MKKQIASLHVITDTAIQKRFTHLELTELAIAGGAKLIQYREKLASTSERIATAASMKKFCVGSGVAFMVNDRVDIALASDADGVHLGQDDLPLYVARKLLGDFKIIGVSTTNIEQAREAEQNGANYIGFGNIFPTTSKIKTTPAKGLVELQKLCKAVSIPVIAIGGITRKNVQDVLKCGAYGIAVIGDVCGQEHPEEAVREFIELIEAVT
jgi:thiamine-phosphate pyrophosphorylase